MFDRFLNTLLDYNYEQKSLGKIHKSYITIHELLGYQHERLNKNPRRRKTPSQNLRASSTEGQLFSFSWFKFSIFPQKKAIIRRQCKVKNMKS